MTFDLSTVTVRQIKEEEDYKGYESASGLSGTAVNRKNKLYIEAVPLKRQLAFRVADAHDGGHLMIDIARSFKAGRKIIQLGS